MDPNSVSPDLQIAPYGDHAWLITATSGQKPVTLAESIRQQRQDNRYLGSAIAEVVPGAEAVLVIANLDSSGAPRPDLQVPLTKLLREVDLDRAEAAEPRLVTLEVDYDGADLVDVATKLDLSPQALIQLHSKPTYEVAFCGFAPGFAYLTGLDPRLHLPRLDTPRPQVPAGSVAIADSYSAVYPQSSPGGWHLLGHTSTTLFDISKQEPALLQPGTQVRFVPRGSAATQAAAPNGSTESP